MAKKRGIFPFDIGIIHMIYSYAIHKYPDEECPLQLLECSHTFHLHCMNLWRTKRNFCPLCNTRNPNGIIIYGNNWNYESCMLVEQKHPYKRLKYMEEEKLVVQAIICRILKHNKYGYGLAELKWQTQSNYIHHIDADVFTTALQECIRKEFVQLEEKNEKFVYVP